MRVRRAWVLLAGACALALAAAAGSHAASPASVPAVARPRYQVGDQVLGAGTAFFLAIAAEPGAVAVTTAHAHELDMLGEAGEVVFERGQAQVPITSSNRLMVEPGRPFSEEGASLGGDYLVFALDTPLNGARALAPHPQPASRLKGVRVQILGVPATIAQDEDDLWGTVVSAGDTELEVRLDVPNDLRGWGGAPVIHSETGGVIGLVEAAYPDAGTYRLGVAAIGPIVEALRTPAAAGLGIPLTRYRAAGNLAEAADAVPAAEEQEGSVDDALSLDARAGRAPEADGPLLGQAGALSTDLQVEIEYPSDGDYIGDTEGAFVSGRALALLGEFRRFDVIFVIDRSQSTEHMTGIDLNGNGIVGEERVGGMGALFGSTDGGDSILAAELLAARRVLENLDPRNTRVGLVSFEGTRPPDEGDPRYGGGIVINLGGGSGEDAVTEAALTTDYDEISSALDRVWRKGSDGSTNMTEAIRLAVRELRGFRGSLSTPDPGSEKIILFFTDGQPTLPYQNVRRNVRSVIRASDQAHRADIRIHSFAIGPDALRRPTATVEMAKVTGGYFTPVRDPGDLVDVVENVSFANIESLEIRNATLDRPAFETTSAADGSFAALVPLQTGHNTLEVRVRAADGTEAAATVDVTHAAGVSSPRLPRALVAKRTQLLERRLISVRRGRIEAERRQAEEARRALAIEIEKERAKAEADTAQQRREIRIEIEEENARP